MAPMTDAHLCDADDLTRTERYAGQLPLASLIVPN